MIAQMEDGVPQVGRHDGRVAIFAVADGENHGFLLPPAGALQVALRMIGAVQDLVGTNLPAFDVAALDLEGMSDASGERFAALNLQVQSARLSVSLTLEQLAELAAATRALSVAADKAGS